MCAAYRHIVDLMRAEGADNLQWVWHVNWLDEPEKNWNRFENYFPGDRLLRLGRSQRLWTNHADDCAMARRVSRLRCARLIRVS